MFAEDAGQSRKGGKKANFLEIFSPSMLKTTILTCLLTTGAQGGYYAITFWIPTFLRTERKLTVLGTSGYIAVIIIGSLIGYWVSAWLNDRIGRRANFILFAVCSIDHRVRLHADPGRQHDDAVPRIPARLLRLGNLLRHGAVPDRIVPHAHARIGPGLRL